MFGMLQKTSVDFFLLLHFDILFFCTWYDSRAYP